MSNRIEYEFEMCVGCGGVLFHSMSALACEMNVRGAEQHGALFVDGDEVEERNMERQAWSMSPVPGATKSFRAAEVYRRLNCRGSVWEIARFVRNGADIVELIESFKDLRNTVRTRVVLYSFADTAAGRRACRDGLLAAVRGDHEISEGWLVMAGNDLDSGQCWGYRCDKNGWVHPGGALESGEMHRIITQPAGEMGQTDRHSCGARVEQSTVGNMLTAICVQRVLKGLREGSDTIEVYWQRRASREQRGGTERTEIWIQTVL